MDRRHFLQTMGAAGLFTIVPRKVLGKGFIAPSDQLTKAVIGVGGIGRSSSHFSNSDAYRLLAVCDVDKKHLQSAVDAAKSQLKIDVKAYDDWRELIHNSGAKAGKDIWLEKPMTRTIGEGKAVKAAVERYGRILRLNTWFRFTDTFYGLGTPVKPLKKLIQSGLLGWPLKVTVSGATGFAWKFFWVGKDNLTPEPVPAELNYDMWLGPAPFKPYNVHRTHQTFRGYWDYDGGGLTDMGQHYLDPVQYMLGKDNEFPVKVEIDAPQQHYDAVGIWHKITYTYADGCQIVLEGEGYESQGKLAYIEGPKGKVYKGFECTIPDVWNKLNELPDPEPQRTDFLECVRSRQKFALNEDNGHHSCTLVNMGAVGLRLGRRVLNFDPKTQLFIGDDAANALVDQPMRGEWKI